MGLDIDFYYVKQKELGGFRSHKFLASYFENLLDKEDINGEDIVLSRRIVNKLHSDCRAVMKDHGLAAKYFPGSKSFHAVDYDEWFFQEVEEVADYIKNKIQPRFDRLDEDIERIIVNVNW